MPVLAMLAAPFRHSPFRCYLLTAVSSTAGTLTLASNRTIMGPQLEQILIRARLQLLGRAYLHHYERYGVGVRVGGLACCLGDAHPGAQL